MENNTKNKKVEVPRACRGTHSGWKVYIAKAATGRYYTGITNDVLVRIEKHNNGRGSNMVIQQGPFILVYESESFPTKFEARKREVQIKRWSRSKK